MRCSTAMLEKGDLFTRQYEGDCKQLADSCTASANTSHSLWPDSTLAQHGKLWCCSAQLECKRCACSLENFDES